MSELLDNEKVMFIDAIHGSKVEGNKNQKSKIFSREPEI